MKYPNIVKKVSTELNLPEELVSRTYDSYWKFIRDSIQNLPLKDDLSEDEFNKLPILDYHDWKKIYESKN